MSCSPATEVKVASSTIGKSGGTLETTGLRLVVPADALTDDLVITAEPTLINGVASFKLGPDGTQFAVPIDVELGFDPAKVGEDPELIHISEATGTEIVLSTIDHAAHTLKGQISSFSTVSAGACCTAFSNFSLTAIDQTSYSATLEAFIPRGSAFTRLELTSADGLGFHADADFTRVMRMGMRRLPSGDFAASYTDSFPSPGFGRSYRLYALIARNGVLERSGVLAEAGAFSTPSDRVVLEAKVLGNGVLDIMFSTSAGPSTRTCTSTCVEELPVSTPVEFIATPRAGHHLTGFEGDCAALAVGSRTELVMRANRRCIARFEPDVVEATFFVTSLTGKPGVDFTGIASLDAFCTAQARAANSTLAMTSQSRNWIAFTGISATSTTATARIGTGPWVNAVGNSITLAALRDGTVPSADIRTQSGRLLPATDDEVATNYGQYTPEPIAVDAAERLFIQRERDAAARFGFTGTFCNDMSTDNGFLWLRVGHAAWETPRAGDSASVTRNATSSFDRHCPIASPSVYDYVSSSSGTPMTAELPASGGLHLYCFAQ
ncbi:MAG: hypothetical protein QM817_04575 [Archangium sp.]